MESKILKAIEGLREDFNGRFDALTSQVNENTQILKALEHLAQLNKAEHDKMLVDIAETKGEVIAIRKELSAVELITANNWSDIVKLKSIK
ncbi:MAG: hypothetical protein P4L59_19530 [Desulfosporosinus sp.]|nr:hypothetical protein [Desulfosporosinus sp.]